MMGRQLALLFSLLLNLVLLYSLIWGEQGAVAYNSLKELAGSLEQRIDTLHVENAVLRQEIQLLQSDEKYIEKMIRKRMNFVRDNEILYIFPDQPGRSVAGGSSNETKN